MKLIISRGLPGIGLPEEIWRQVVGHLEYEVSNLGGVRRFAPASGARVGTVIKAWTSTHGRAVVSLSSACRVKKRFVHHLVLEAFVGPRPVGKECAHYDGNPLNNQLCNLRWDTPRGNAADKIRHGTNSVPAYSRKGEQHPSARLTAVQVRDIRKRLEAGETTTAIAGDCGVSRYAISDIKRGKSWRHL